MEPDTPLLDFDTEYSSICGAVGAQGLRGQVIQRARALQAQYPDRALSYFLLNLVYTVYNIHGGGRSDDMFGRATCCPDYNRTVGGDIQRDRAIALIRYRQDRGDLRVAARLLVEVQDDHHTDPNRMACLLGVRGRLAFASGEYRAATALHQMADTNWQFLQDQGRFFDTGWRSRNLLHWLRATVADEGRKSHRTANLARRVQQECERGTLVGADQVALLTKTPFGLWLFRRYEASPPR